jgi:ubiquinone/menaquinone biosynthesis C-methylase UbiE
MTPPAAQQRYWLGDSPPEISHLLAQAEFLGPDAADLLDRIGVAPGADVIDIGCGVLGILPQLRSRVGAGGRVVGLDIEPLLLAVAAQLSAQHDLAVQTVRADAASTGLPSGSFDLVHERMLLLNVTSPQQVVAEMARLARPGGVVAVQEPDSAAWATDPPHPAWELLLTEVNDVYPRTGRDFHTGRRAARLLRDAGLREVQVRALARLTAPGEYFQMFLLTLAVLMREDILAGGRLTPGQLDSAAAELREHLSQPRHAHLPADHLAGLGPQTRCQLGPGEEPGHHRAGYGPAVPAEAENQRRARTTAGEAHQPGASRGRASRRVPRRFRFAAGTGGPLRNTRHQPRITIRSERAWLNLPTHIPAAQTRYVQIAIPRCPGCRRWLCQPKLNAVTASRRTRPG